MAQLKLMKKEWMNWFKGTTLENITAWTEYYYINPDSQHWISNYQLWDEEWEVGTYSSSTGEKVVATDKIRNKNPIKVVPNTTYYGFGSGRTAFYYDINHNYIGSEWWYSNTTINIPNNVYYINFAEGSNYGTTYNHDICINKSNPTFNGHYEPYIIKIEDILGVVDLGSLNWIYQSVQKRFYAELSSIKNYSNTELSKLMTSNGYLPRVFNDLVYGSEDKTIASYNQFVTIRDTLYTDVNSFKQAMSGVYLVYIKLDSPIG